MTTANTTMDRTPQVPTLFGHPAGLFTLFFAEMWERFSFYGMRALLVFYMIKGFLGYGDTDAYGVYGAYTALVYMTPFFGGMLADRLLGARRAIIFGAVLMTAGEFLLAVPNRVSFFAGLAMLICGNGFFKPNISTIVGSLYPANSTKRDGGFTIFYMGINLGAAMSPLLCGYIGEVYGWSWGFAIAGFGMLLGLLVFSNWLPPAKAGSPPDVDRLHDRPVIVTQCLIALGAVSAAAAMFWFHPENPFSTGVNVFVGVWLLIAAVVGIMALRGSKGGLITTEWSVYLGSVLATIAFVFLVSGFSVLTSDGRPFRIIPQAWIDSLQNSPGQFRQLAAVILPEVSSPAGFMLVLSGLIAFGYIGFQTVRMDKIPRQRMYVVLILTFFSMLFFSFFEQAGSSVNNFTDRNVNRVFISRTVTADEVGKTIRLQPTQAQLGYHNGDQLFTLNVLDKLRSEHKADPDFEINWKVADDNAGMGIAKRIAEIPASTFQSVNPVYILLFGLVFSTLWTMLARVGAEPSTTVKFALGLLQLGLGFGAFWYGAQTADQRGIVSLVWLLLGYLLHTTGELCLSPVGLSMVTRLSPRYLVSTVMGTWFLASAFSQFLAAIIAQFTGVSGGGDGRATVIPAPIETVHVYGGVFGKIAISAIISAAVCFALSPILKRWMHPESHDPT
jgi:POT family proton-dependent oligopeptide transporter